ncbi:MAG TPA: diadenylate cyclase, partial [Polyangiaceae bacterium]
VGSRAFFAGMARQQETRVIDEVVAAATELARHRMGALICFEQDANLDEFVGVNKGHELDAAVSSELLVSIFVPEGVNKLHDGAVIIRDLRIAKAGVFFPMPDSRVLDASFGSRHRASLGITEETDAVVVVVSEERGTIGFCFNGNIVGNLDGPGLRRALEGVFSPRRRRGKAPISKREPVLVQRLSAEPSSLVGLVGLVGRTAAEPARPRVEPARAALEPEDPTLVSVPSEAGETPTTRIRTTETDLESLVSPPAQPPLPLRKTKAEKQELDPSSVVIPGAGRVQKLAPLTTPMRAPGTPMASRPKTDPGVRGPSSTSGPGDAGEGGTTPDSSEGGGAP